MDEEEYTILIDSREDHWRGVPEDDYYRSNSYSLRSHVCTKEKEYMVGRYVFVNFLYLKRGDIVWTCVVDNIIR